MKYTIKKMTKGRGSFFNHPSNKDFLDGIRQGHNDLLAEIKSIIGEKK